MYEVEAASREEALRQADLAWEAYRRLVRQCPGLLLGSDSACPDANTAGGLHPPAHGSSVLGDQRAEEMEAERTFSHEAASRKRRAILALAALSTALLSFMALSAILEMRASRHDRGAINLLGRGAKRQISIRSMLSASTELSPPRPTARRRSLSALNAGCGSMPQMTGLVQPPIPQTYLATYPGSGSRAARLLLKAVTGGVLRIQNENEPSRRDDAVAVHTKFPHKSGTMIAWDAGVRLAIVLLRNPMHALPSLFDELYTGKKHLPPRLQPEQPVSIEDAATAGEWASWRDRMYESQMASYREFVLYWVKEYGSHDRLILSYEDLIDEKTGIEDAKRLTAFLWRLESVPTIELDYVPCAWQSVFEDGGGAVRDGMEDAGIGLGAGGRRLSENYEENQPSIMSEEGDRRRLASYINPYPSSIDAPHEARQFTPEQLNSMASILQQMSGELPTNSHYATKLLLRYRDEIMDVVRAPQHDAKAEEVTRKEGGAAFGTSTFHIFVVSPPGTDSPVVTNWLMGLFEPDALYTKLVTSPGLRVYQRGEEVPITATVVTHTNEMNLIGLYKIFKSGYDEVFFVLARSGTDADQQINNAVCQYDNVMCLDYSQQLYVDDREMQDVVRLLTEKLGRRFPAFFGRGAGLGEASALERLRGMESARRAMEREPPDSVDPKFGVRGELENEGGNGANAVDSKVIADPNSPPRRLFYCGSTGTGKNRNFSLMGVFLANAFFPEIVGDVPSEEDTGRPVAIPLTPDTAGDATPNDFLVFHMHQHCDVDVLTFPGQQLHINHPTHGFSAYGKYTPPADNVFVIGAHEEGPRSIHLPYAMMKWWVLVKGLGSHGDMDRPTMEKLFVPSARPRNTGKHFLLYVNSHHVAYREMAAYTLSKLGPVHALGNCQGNIEGVPANMDASRPPRCQPYTDDRRPSSIIVSEDLNRRGTYFNRVTFQDFRFMLLMEDGNIPGFITERIVDGFMAGTVPVYYGTQEVFDVFNPKAFIYYDINNPQQALNHIKYLEDNPGAYQLMLAEPILADGQNTIKKYFSFDDSIGNGELKKRARLKLGFPR